MILVDSYMCALADQQTWVTLKIKLMLYY